SEGKDKYKEDELLHVMPHFCPFGDVLRYPMERTQNQKRSLGVRRFDVRPSGVVGLGNSIPSSLRRELRLPTIVVLPLGPGMRSSVNSNVLAVHHRCRLQVEQSINDF